jgi:hypothetical protein
MLADEAEVLYQHGEAVAPSESLARGARKVFVPLQTVAEQFVQAGYPREDVLVTGLCVEPALVSQAADAFSSRLSRYDGDNPLTGAFFTSGAEPRAHVQSLVIASLAVAGSGGNALVFAHEGGRLHRECERAFRTAGLPLVRLGEFDALPATMPVAALAVYRNRREETALTARLFQHLDYLVAPSHERTNWSLGLGLPQFVVEPCIGPYSPLNRDLLVARDVAEAMPSAREAVTFDKRLRKLRRDGVLRHRARSGWEHLTIRGFARIAEYLMDHYGGSRPSVE